MFYATAEGADTGVPKSVAREFIAHDKPGKLPEHVEHHAMGGGIKLDTSAVPKSGPKVPGFASSVFKPPKPEGISPSTWSERSEAHGLERGHFAEGGGLQAGGEMSPWFERREAEIDMPHGGFVNSGIAGRTDRIPVSVAADSFVMPAAEVSGLGQGNSLAGAHLLSAALRVGPYGTPLERGTRGHGVGIPRPPTMPGELRQIVPESVGGHAHGHPQSHVMIAGGELVIPLHDWLAKGPDGVMYVHRGVRSLGGGDVEKGQKILRDLVQRIREFTIKNLRKLPAPKA